MITLGDIITNDIEFNKLYKYIKDIKIDDIPTMSINEIRNYYFYSDDVNNNTLPDSPTRIQTLDVLLDKFIRKYLLNKIKTTRKKCEEDHCYYENEEIYIEQKLYYACLRFVCKKDYDFHQSKFICCLCEKELCECHIKCGCDCGKESCKRCICWVCDLEVN